MSLNVIREQIDRTVSDTEKAELLIRHYLNLRYEDPDYVERLCDELLESLRATVDTGLWTHLLLCRGRLRLWQSKLDNAEADLQRALTLAHKLEHEYLISDAYQCLGSLMIARGAGNEAANYLKQALERRHNNGWLQVRIHENLGGALAMQGKFLPALQSLNAALALVDNSDFDYPLYSLYSAFGYLYSKLQLYSKAIEYYELAVRESRKGDNTLTEAINLLNMVEAHLCLRRCPDEALEILTRIREILKETNHPATVGSMPMCFGKVYFARGDLAYADKYLHQAHAIAQQYGNSSLECAAKIALADLRNRQNLPDEARTLALDALQLAQTYGYDDDAIKALACLADASAGCGDYPTAYRYMREHSQKIEIWLSQKSESATAEMLTQFDLETSNHHKKLAEAKAEFLTQQVEATRRELVASALQISRNNETLQQIRDSAQSILKSDPDLMRASIHRLVRNIGNSLQDETAWRRFIEQFRYLHTGFLDALTEKHPDLSPTEIKVCALIKMQIPSKQICSILGIAPRSIENYRYRIRKKLGLLTGQNLSAYLNGFGQSPHIAASKNLST